MRAKMSDRWSRPSWGDFKTPGDTEHMTWAEIQVCTEKALSEAKAILAESEPWALGQTTYFPCGVERKALAEALTNFLAE